MQTPEELLEIMGVSRGSVHGHANKDSINKNDNEIRQKDGNVDEHNNDLKGMMQKVLFKFDEFQSSLRKSSSSAKEEANNARSSQTPSEDTSTKQLRNIFSELLFFAKNTSLFTRKAPMSPRDIDELIQQAQSISNHNMSSPSSNNSSQYSSLASSSGFLSQVIYFQQNAQAIQQAFEPSFGPHLSNINVRDLPSFAALHYYLEYQDSIKTDSWMRRTHRFQRNVEVTKVEELNEALILSELSYA